MKTLQLWKYGVAVSLVGSLVLSGCSQKDGGAAGSPTSSSPQVTTAASATKKEKMVLNWFISAPANTTLPDPSKDVVLKTIQEKFNVDLKVEYMTPGADYNTKINALLASTPPDMWRDANADGGNKLAMDGLLATLTDFVTPQTMPNYFKYWVTETALKRYQVQGGFYRAPLPYNKKLFRAYYIRKDWLDALNLKMPTNYDEYVNILKAFTFNDPDGNGKADTYGFSTSGGGANVGYDWPELFKNKLLYPAFVENGKYVGSLQSPKMEFVLNDIAKVIDMKVVDPDWYLNKNPQHVEKAIQGRIGVVVGNVKDFALDNNEQGIQYRSKQINPKADWQPFTIFGETPIMANLSPSGPFLFAKSVAEKNPEKIRRSIEILDWLASEEGYLLTHFGQEGKHYSKDGKTIKPNFEAYTNDIVKQGDYLRIWSFFTLETIQPEVFGLTLIDSRQTDHDRAILKFLNEQPTHIWAGGASLIAPAGFDLAGADKRLNELLSRALFDDKSGKNWPTYLDELMTKYKVKELLEKYTQDLKNAGVIQ